LVGLARSVEVSERVAPAASAAELVLVVGPEGGVSELELATLGEAGAIVSRLGSTVLRTSTAGVVAAAVVFADLGRWDGPAR
jgi:16S rRNA (uracil1498-N3)-methyltransferase